MTTCKKIHLHVLMFVYPVSFFIAIPVSLYNIYWYAFPIVIRTFSWNTLHEFLISMISINVFSSVLPIRAITVCQFVEIGRVEALERARSVPPVCAGRVSVRRHHHVAASVAGGRAASAAASVLLAARRSLRADHRESHPSPSPVHSIPPSLAPLTAPPTLALSPNATFLH